MTDPKVEPRERYAVVELMGRRRLVGRVEDVTLCGAPMLRVESLTTPPDVREVSPSALYCVTWISREQAERETTPEAHWERFSRALLAGPDGAATDRVDDRSHPAVECADCHAAPGSACTSGCTLEGYDDRDDRVPVGAGCLNCGAQGPDRHTASCSRVRNVPDVACAECSAAPGVPCPTACGLRQYPDRDARVPLRAWCGYCETRGPDRHATSCQRPHVGRPRPAGRCPQCDALPRAHCDPDCGLRGHYDRDARVPTTERHCGHCGEAGGDLHAADCNRPRPDDIPF